MKLHKVDVGFAQVANEVLNSKKLTWKAKGLYAYLYSKSDDYDFSSYRIAKDGIGGRKAVMAALKELETENLLVRVRHGSGRVSYLLGVKPIQSAEKELWHPKSGLGTVPKRHRAQTAPVTNTDSGTNKEKKTNTDFASATSSPLGRRLAQTIQARSKMLR